MVLLNRVAKIELIEVVIAEQILKGVELDRI